MAPVNALTRYRRAADFLAAAMIYLRDNVLLREPLRPEHLKPRLLGHWGTCPGITFVYSGLNGLVSRHRAADAAGDRPGSRRAGQPREPVARGHARADTTRR